MSYKSQYRILSDVTSDHSLPINDSDERQTTRTHNLQHLSREEKQKKIHKRMKARKIAKRKMPSQLGLIIHFSLRQICCFRIATAKKRSKKRKKFFLVKHTIFLIAVTVYCSSSSIVNKRQIASRSHKQRYEKHEVI